MKTIFVFTAFFFCLLVGCSTHPPAAKNSESPKPAVSDDFKIERAVYAYLLEKHPWDSDEYGAIFLEGDDVRVTAMIKNFPNHVPPLKPASRARRQPNQAPVDKDTGKPGMVLSAKAVDPTNGVSEAVGTWSAGEAVSGLYAFVLVETDGEWTIQSVK